MQNGSLAHKEWRVLACNSQLRRAVEPLASVREWGPAGRVCSRARAVLAHLRGGVQPLGLGRVHQRVNRGAKSLRRKAGRPEPCSTTARLLLYHY